MTAMEATPSHEHPAHLAAQREAAGRFAEAARLYRLAGEEALARYDSAAAIDCLSQALVRTSDARPGERYELLLQRERAYGFLGEQTLRRADLASLEALADQLQDDGRRAEVCVRQAQHREAVGEYESGITLAQLGLRLAQIAGSARLEAAAHLVWGIILVRQGSYIAAGAQLSRARAKASEAGEQALEAETTRALGLLAVNKGALAEAGAYLNEALMLARLLGDRRGESTCLNNLGHIAYNAKRFTEAGGHWEQALEAYEAIGDRQGRSMTLINLGAMHMDVGQYGQACQVLEEALATCREVQSRYGEAMALINLGLVHAYQGAHEEAALVSQEAVDIGQEMGSRRLEAYGLVPLSQAKLGQGEIAGAESACWQSLAIWHELGQAALEAEQRAALARVALAGGREGEAMVQVEWVLTHLTEDGELAGTESPFRVYLTCYEVLRGQGDGRANAVLERAYNQLQARAADIADEPLRAAYLRDVTAHQAVVAAYNDLHAS